MKALGYLVAGYAIANAVIACNRLARFEAAVGEAFATRDQAIVTAFQDQRASFQHVLQGIAEQTCEGLRIVNERAQAAGLNWN